MIGATQDSMTASIVDELVLQTGSFEHKLLQRFPGYDIKYG